MGLLEHRLIRAASAALTHVAIVGVLGVVAASLHHVVIRPSVVASVLVGACAIIAEVRAQRGDDVRAEELTDRRLAGASALSVALVTIVGPIESAVRGSTSGAPLLVLSLSIAFAGISLRARAIGILGSQFVTAARTRGDRALVERDVYAFVRHPSETGLVLFATATATLTGSVVALVGAAATLLLAVARARREDAELGRAFPDEHGRYAHRVGSLVPAPLRSSKGASVRDQRTKSMEVASETGRWPTLRQT